jgi:hypothetical protein
VIAMVDIAVLVLPMVISARTAVANSFGPGADVTALVIPLAVAVIGAVANYLAVTSHALDGSDKTAPPRQARHCRQRRGAPAAGAGRAGSWLVTGHAAAGSRAGPGLLAGPRRYPLRSVWCSGRGPGCRAHRGRAWRSVSLSTSVSMTHRVTPAAMFSSLLDFAEVGCNICDYRWPFWRRSLVTGGICTMIAVADACNELSAGDGW